MVRELSRQRARRSGGGGVHQLPWRRLVNPYRPIEILSADQVEAMHASSLRVLEEFGIEFLDDESGVARGSARLVGDVLVWQVRDMVYRIESPLGRDATLDIARSMTGRSVSPPPAGR